MSKPEIFRPYILLKRIADAGMVSIHGGSYSSNDLVFEVNGGSPFQSAYNEAFKLALACQLPLWREEGIELQLLYSPSVGA